MEEKSRIMELYETIQKRHTVRDFLTKSVPEDILWRILDAGMKAPSHDHARDWHFVVLHDPERIAEVLKHVGHGAEVQTGIIDHWDTATECQKAMYYDALPKQVKMLSQSRCLILPFFRAGADLLMPRDISTLNPFASIWCLIQNILLAATAENLGCALRIPILDEEAYVLKTIQAPEGYRFPCYLAVGYPAPDAGNVQQQKISLQERIHLETW